MISKERCLNRGGGDSSSSSHNLLTGLEHMTVNAILAPYAFI
jgi:hypothetical protein